MNQSYTDMQKQIAELTRASQEQALKEKIALKQRIEQLAAESPYDLKDILATRVPRAPAKPKSTKQPDPKQP